MMKLARMIALAAGMATATVTPSGADGLAFYTAAAKGNAEMVRLLIEAGANVNNNNTYLDTDTSNPKSENIEYLTALHGAVMGETSLALFRPDETEERIEIVKMLIEAGADVNATASNGYTPLSIAIDNNMPTIARILIEAGARP